MPQYFIESQNFASVLFSLNKRTNMFSSTGYRVFGLLLTIQITDLKGPITQNQALHICEENTRQLLSLLTLACLNAGGAAVRACVDRLSFAVRANNNQPSISALSLVAEQFFRNTRYDECADIIAIADCFNQASEDNPAQLEEEQVILFKNITSCILAMSRCSAINPITGQRQENTFSTTTFNNPLGKPVTTTVPLYNALQINQAGDLRVIAFPGTIAIQRYFCPYEFNLRQSSWLTYNC
ncbi:uncharacterized protein LOC132695554 isoform X2 [Cylas formicarius]|uniref:uncharacterized protein LOC132695554 isoform X2 n=1 Tax=Cylas formicarius TaxID=197179 RepID=UPI00295843DF|nr:uncharacterized protein LOC132695554 isoform X2 [Cylas formicarius]